MTHVLFEEDGQLKTGTILTDADSSLNIETSTGKRSKIKAQNVLLRFNAPAANALLTEAQQLAEAMETPFLWECASDTEFGFGEFATDYFGHAANAIESTALLLALQKEPIYFHRKGRGRFRKAPAEILAAAIAGLEKKRLAALLITRMSHELQTGVLPAEFTQSIITQLLYQPDRNRPECKALEEAASLKNLSPTQILMGAGALNSPYELHFGRFLFDTFPEGVDFPAFDAPQLPQNLPQARVKAFSIDDKTTVEIDDAFSLEKQENGFRIGIHIAAPSLVISPESDLGKIARARLSTIYMPGNKITMLPKEAFTPFSLDENATKPAISLYLTVDQHFAILQTESLIEDVFIAANLRLEDLETVFQPENAPENPPENAAEQFPFQHELNTLFKFAKAHEKLRGKDAAKPGLFDYNFAISGDLKEPENCRVTIKQRARGGSLDVLVSELMIVANSIWGKLLADKTIPALYRTQSEGKVRMSTNPAPHEGLGVSHYAWMSSPLRRYVDLLNQWQLISAINGETPRFGARSDALFAALRDFELSYASYNDFQKRMELYWSLRYLAQENISEINATILRDNLCKLDGIPLIQRFSSVPEGNKGDRVQLQITGFDFLILHLEARFIGKIELVDAEIAEEIVGKTAEEKSAD